jgi:serine/threonine-protein kinase
VTAERVGRYQLLDPIGVGPTGAVSRAKVFGVAGYERQFAVKRFHADITSSTALAQALSAAARAYGGLEHPRIARMTEFGVAKGTTYTAIEYVAGLDAMKLVTEARLSGVTLAVGGALALVSQAARAIGYAHGRGLTHLGLAPTNVIVTAEGDVKITDFGIFAATLPTGPINVAEQTRIANRIAYLAPEQIAGEAASAATDVFALGLLAYELVGGGPAYRGASPQALADAILAGPPGELPLPRPIARVLTRCLARSPFERFPDARALADSLDAAVRVAPVPGTRKDIGAHVAGTLERLAQLRESEQSGMLAFNVGTGPTPKLSPVAATLGSAGRAAPVALEGLKETIPDDPSRTQPEIARPMHTMPGLAPPPIPVPPIGRSKTPTPSPPSIPRPKVMPAPTLVGLPIERRTPGLQPAIPPIPGPPRLNTDLSIPIEPAPAHHDDDGGLRTLEDQEVVELAAARMMDDPARDMLTDEMSPILKDGLNRAAGEKGTAEMEPLVEDAYRADAYNEFPDEEHVSQKILPPPDDPIVLAPYQEQDLLDSPALQAPSAAQTKPGMGPPPEERRRERAASQPVAPLFVEPASEEPPRKSRVPLIAGTLIALGAIGVGGWFAYDRLRPRDDGTSGGTAIERRDAAASPDALVALVDDAGGIPMPSGSDASIAIDATQLAVVDAGKVTVDAAQVAAATPDAAISVDAAVPVDAAQVAVVTPDAAVLTPDAATPIVVTPGAGLKIATTPSRARVYIDGADVGKTPLAVGGSKDRHSIALFVPGYDLYRGDIDGSGAFTIPLAPAAKFEGEAGIKVLKCAANRYYVYVDGKPTGQLCPTEQRIDAALGKHTVEVFDMVSETTRKWDIEILDTRLSFRVRIDP